MYDVFEKFKTMSFTAPVPKVSAQARYRAFTNEIEERSLAVKKRLTEFDPIFTNVTLAVLGACVVDESLVSYLTSNHVQLGCPGNKCLAFLGDSFLSLYIATETFRHGVTGGGMSGQQMQKVRERSTSEARLNHVYGLIFGEEDVIVRWKTAADGNKPPSPRQRAEFIEALIGGLYWMAQLFAENTQIDITDTEHYIMCKSICSQCYMPLSVMAEINK